MSAFCWRAAVDYGNPWEIQRDTNALIVAHNHPAGALTPSVEDIETIETLINAGKLLGVLMVDRIIVSSNSIRRSPTQATEARVVPIRGNPFAARLYSQSRQPGILHQISARRRITAQLLKNRPVSLAGLYQCDIRLLQQSLCKFLDVLQSTGTNKDARVGNDTH
jgi:RadC-like JAB domain